MARISTSELLKALRTHRKMHVKNLSEYFTSDFTGSHFESFAGGGDAITVQDRITPEDLLAVTCLGVYFPASATLNLLEGDAANGVAKQLSLIPNNVDLHSMTTNPIAENSAAWKAWDLIDDLDDIGRTLTSKLLARKRPRLLPVLDEVVVCALKLGEKNNWRSIYELLTEDSGRVVSELQIIQRQAARKHVEISRISTLRVLDITVWMEHGSDHKLRPHKKSQIFI